MFNRLASPGPAGMPRVFFEIGGSCRKLEEG
jgi:hypothetical protein